MMTKDRAGKIVTFYSYKGGTGRSMALANVAWILASAGKRVLTIDWDLEAPGLHRYFEPFLTDKNLGQSTGLIDFVRDFAAAAVAPAADCSASGEWYEAYSDLLAHALPVDWEFPDGAALHLVPAGRQDGAYGLRVNSFDWHAFYERLGGGILLEAVKKNLRRAYDFILIDSRTGVSDTSGVCTMQMPDEIVVCFTLNRQSIYGASSAARLAFESRHTPSGVPTLKVWPVPTRVETSEKDRLELTSTLARARFSGLMPQLDPEKEDAYWGEIAVGYEPYYAYEEVLAPFRDRPRQTASMLYHMETIAGYLTGEVASHSEMFADDQKAVGLAKFTARSALDCTEEFGWLGLEYERLRRVTEAGAARTELMSLLVGRVQTMGGDHDAGIMAERLFIQGSDGGRIAGLALARKDPQRQHVELALRGISDSRSAFEQFQALMLADALLATIQPAAAAQLASEIQAQIGKTIDHQDLSRLRPAQRLVKRLGEISGSDVRPSTIISEYDIGGHCEMIVSVTPSSTLVRYDDPKEMHGPWVGTRGSHAIRLPQMFQLGRYPVTNAFFRMFVQGGGYENDSFWPDGRKGRRRFVTADGESPGPGHWHGSGGIPEGLEEHPVTSICFLEARAFVNWCTTVDSFNRWSLPREDPWEFAARSDNGQIYPWGDVFDPSLCNSAETGIGGTSLVHQFEAGASKAGCCDMAGNVWDFVLSGDDGFVLRGGSFTNNRSELRSYLRLFGVTRSQRAPDFGFRLALISPVA